MPAMTNLADLLKLPATERLELIEALWDSLDADIQKLPLTDAQNAEIDRRLAAYEKDPSATLDAETVHKRLWSLVK